MFPPWTGGTTPGPGRAAGPFSFACPNAEAAAPPFLLQKQFLGYAIVTLSLHTLRRVCAPRVPCLAAKPAFSRRKRGAAASARKWGKRKRPPGGYSLRDFRNLCKLALRLRSGLKHAEITPPKITPLMNSPRGPPTTERRDDDRIRCVGLYGCFRRLFVGV
jgi:hypothetical protein